MLFPRKPLALSLTALGTSLALVLSGCSAGGESSSNSGDRSEAAANVLETKGPETIADEDGSGIEVSRRFFESADHLVVVVGRNIDEQHAAAKKAVADGVPMVLFDGDNGLELAEEFERLGAKEIIAYGDSDDLTEELGDLIEEGDLKDFDLDSLKIEKAEVAEPTSAPASPEASPETSPSPAPEPQKPISHGELVAEVSSWAPASGHPIKLPPVMATRDSSVPSVAITKAAGGELHLLEVPDPRVTTEAIRLVRRGDTIALGLQFGSNEAYAEKVALADNGELPGGGGLVFPGRRMIALYGHPSGGALGAMGEQPPAEAVARLQPMVEQYQALEKQPVIPAFEIIVTVASEFPGEDGNYSNEGAPEEFVGYIDAITKAGGYAVLDLQPGRATFLEQAKLYEDLLKRPNVGLAVDPEWRIGPNEFPMQRIGNTTAAEINEVANWLADLTRENNLPQKLFVVHQFQLQMVRDREEVDTTHPELAFVLHADGHGTPDLKFETWNVLQEGLEGDWYMAWKNFIDEDTPTFTPQQTYETVNPRPWFVSYQ